jgi:hypothetical protein
MAKTNNSTSEEKTQRILNSIFILQAAQLGLSGAEIRKILGIGMGEVTLTMKAVTRAQRKRATAKIA